MKQIILALLILPLINYAQAFKMIHDSSEHFFPLVQRDSLDNLVLSDELLKSGKHIYIIRVAPFDDGDTGYIKIDSTNYSGTNVSQLIEYSFNRKTTEFSFEFNVKKIGKPSKDGYYKRFKIYNLKITYIKLYEI